MDFDENRTLAVIFDTEWYVPPIDRTRSSIASLKANPAKGEHTFIGGIFSRFFPLKNDSRPETKEIFVKDLSQDEELKAMKSVYAFFVDSWNMIAEKRDNVPDLITIGTGISRLDIPGLYVKSSALNIDTDERLYETFLKTKVVDLSDTSIPYLNRNRPRMLYPVTTNSIVRRFGIKTDMKSTGKSVWDLADSNDFLNIRKRVRQEMGSLWLIYKKLVNEIFK